MKFHFEFDIKKLSPLIDHRHKLFLIGSCFTENIGEKLRSHKFSVLENPNGILFNPVSVAEAITDYIENRNFTKDDFFNYNEAWHSWKHHSRFSAPMLEEAVAKVNSSTIHAHQYLKNADYLLLTLGSSWIYTLTDKALNTKKDTVAANNHKAPSDWFYRRLMNTEELHIVMENMLHRLLHFNPNLKIIFTISPVRHLREGVIENNRSKAILIQSVHQLIDQSDKLYYFPAYELVLDDLRDYRFYSEDLVHPNYFATQYVWEKFITACISDESKKIMEEVASFKLALNHKPFNAQSKQHKNFLQLYYEKAKKLQELYPYLNLDKELEYFKNHNTS